LLLLLIFLSLACYYFAECKSPVAVVEGLRRGIRGDGPRTLPSSRPSLRRGIRGDGPRTLPSSRPSLRRGIRGRRINKVAAIAAAAKAKAARIAAAAKAAAKRALEEKHKMVQEKIHTALVEGVPTGEGISNCAVSYGDNLQLGKNADLFSIFGNNDILKCNEDGIPEFVPAKQKKINKDGIYLLNQNENNASDQVMYGDTVSLCNKNYTYTISGKDSNTQVKYGDNITMTPTTVNKNSSVIHATVNPNVYSLPNLMNLNSADYNAEYVKKYQHCGNSGGNNYELAKI